MNDNAGKMFKKKMLTKLTKKQKLQVETKYMEQNKTDGYTIKLNM